MRYRLMPFLLLFAIVLSGQVSELSDEFESPCALYDWTDVSDYEGWDATHLETKDVDLTNEGQLTMMPYTTAWFANYRSTLLFKEVSGDFTFTTQVTASNRDEDGMPDRPYSLAGIMIRTPRDTLAAQNNWQTGMANYVFMALGFAATNHSTCSGCQGPHFEVKSTTNSNSSLRVAAIDTLTAEIRMLRVDDAILVLYKTPDEEYVVHQRYHRPDMPDMVQIGFVTYTDWPNVSGQNAYSHNSQNQSFDPDLIAKFDYGRVEALDLPSWLEGEDWQDSTAVSTDTVLTYFGYDSEYTGRADWKIWKGTTDGDWSTAANWSGNTVPIASDSILIPNCECPEVSFPTLSGDSNTYASLVVEEGASVHIASTAALTFDVIDINSIVENYGTITNEGSFSVLNMGSRAVVNTGTIECQGQGQCHFEE